MSRALRWQVAVPRLLLLLVVVLAAQHGFGLVVRLLVGSAGEAAIDSRVTADHARVSPWHRQVVLGNLRLDSHSSQHVIEADRCALDFAVKPLLHKRLVIERGTVSGLRFDTRGKNADTSTESAAQSSIVRFPDAAAAAQWLERLNEKFDNKLVTQFESVRLTDELCVRWPKQAAAIRARVTELNERAAQLQKEMQTAQANPLRHVAFLSNLAKNVAALQAEFTRVQAEAEKLLESLEADRRAIVAARQGDDQFVRQQLRLEPVDAEALSAYLLREQVTRPLEEVIGWLRWARQVVPAVPMPPGGQKRGENVLFAGCRPLPKFLIRELRLQGAGRVGSQPVAVLGTLTDYTTAPSLHAKPMRLRLKTTGSLPLDLQATIDRTGPLARDELLVDCRGIVLPKMDLGQPNEFRLSLLPSVGSLSISLSVEGDKLAGDIQLVQKQVKMTPVLTGGLSAVPLAAMLKDTLGNVDALALRVSLSGSLNEPRATLWSNLGPAVAESMERALERAGDQHARSLLAQAQHQVDERLAWLERHAAEHQADLLAQATNATSALQTIAAQQAPPRRLTHEQLGRRLPTGSLFR